MFCRCFLFVGVEPAAREMIDLCRIVFALSSLDLSEFAKAAKKKLQSVRHFDA